MPALSSRNCEPRRASKNCVSSGRLPYQITRYCDEEQVHPEDREGEDHLAEVVHARLVISPSRPGAVAVQHAISAVAATPERKPPQAKYAPKRFEYQVGVERHHLVEGDEGVAERVHEADDRREHAAAGGAEFALGVVAAPAGGPAREHAAATIRSRRASVAPRCRGTPSSAPRARRGCRGPSRRGALRSGTPPWRRGGLCSHGE